MQFVLLYAYMAFVSDFGSGFWCLLRSFSVFYEYKYAFTKALIQNTVKIVKKQHTHVEIIYWKIYKNIKLIIPLNFYII